MIIVRKLFSSKVEGEKNKEEKDKPRKKDKSIAVGAGLVGATTAGNAVLGKKLKNYLETEASEEGEHMFDKLKRYAERKGIKVDEVSETGMGPAYHKGTVYTDGTKRKSMKVEVKNGVLSLVGDEVKTGKGRHGSLISHEIGHAHFDKGKAKGIGEKIGKVAHKIYLKGGGIVHHNILPGVAGIAAGIKSGKKKADLEEEGKEESKLNKHSAWVAPLAVQTPGLVSEGAASKYGYNLLKKAGASKKYLKHTRGKLLGAFGTYAATALGNVGTGELARGLAYRQRKKKIEKEKEEKEED